MPARQPDANHWLCLQYVADTVLPKAAKLKPSYVHQQGADPLLLHSVTELGTATIASYGLPVLTLEALLHNIEHGTAHLQGGQAEVHLCKWHNLPASPEAAGEDVINHVIAEGQPVAIKHVLMPIPGGSFAAIKTLQDFNRARAFDSQQLRIEINLLSVLRNKKLTPRCDSRVIEPLAVVRWPGVWYDDEAERAKRWWEPTYVYVMPAYERGSVSKLLGDICHRRVDDSVSQRFLNYRAMSSELSVLLGELHKIHTTPGCQLMLQDLTPNNILVDDDGSSMRLLFTDPAVAAPIGLLGQLEKWRSVRGTWLWGSMRARGNRFDPKADLYSLCVIFAEVWLTAEGATLPPMELVQLIGIQADRAQGVHFLRCLMIELLRTRLHGGSMQPRVSRHEPVAWLGAWALLLGFRDYNSAAVLKKKLPCLRPSEEQMLKVLHLWACIADAAQALPPNLTDEAALSPAHRVLVCDMTRLLGMLVGLSHLEDAGEQQDASLAWLAANFLAQKHPLVAAMAAQGAMGVGEPEKMGRFDYAGRGWPEAVKVAHSAAGYTITTLASLEAERGKHQEDLRRGKEAEATLAELGQWFEQLHLKEQQGSGLTGVANDMLPPERLRLACKAAAVFADSTRAAAPAAAAGPSAVSAAEAWQSTGSDASRKRKGLDGELAPAEVPVLQSKGYQQLLLGDNVGKLIMANVLNGEAALQLEAAQVTQQQHAPAASLLAQQLMRQGRRACLSASCAVVGAAASESLAAALAKAMDGSVVHSAPACIAAGQGSAGQGSAGQRSAAASGQHVPDTAPPEGSPSKRRKGSTSQVPASSAAGSAGSDGPSPPAVAGSNQPPLPAATGSDVPLLPAVVGIDVPPLPAVTGSGSGAAAFCAAGPSPHQEASSPSKDPAKTPGGSTLSYYPEHVQLYKNTLKALTNPSADVGDEPGQRAEIFRAIDSEGKLLRLLLWWDDTGEEPVIYERNGTKMPLGTKGKSRYIRAVAEAARPGSMYNQRKENGTMLRAVQALRGELLDAAAARAAAASP